MASVRFRPVDGSTTGRLIWPDGTAVDCHRNTVGTEWSVDLGGQTITAMTGRGLATKVTRSRKRPRAGDGGGSSAAPARQPTRYERARGPHPPENWTIRHQPRPPLTRWERRHSTNDGTRQPVERGPLPGDDLPPDNSRLAPLPFDGEHYDLDLTQPTREDNPEWPGTRSPTTNSTPPSQTSPTAPSPPAESSEPAQQPSPPTTTTDTPSEPAPSQT